MVKIIFFTVQLFLSLELYAWTLNNNFTGSFKNNKVKVFVDEGTTCINNNITTEELLELIDPATNKFWNTIPTSNLELIPSGFSTHIPEINQGRLCSPTNEECIDEGNQAGEDNPLEGLIPAVNEIVIACNSNSLNFGGSNVLAVTIPNKYSGSKIIGALIIINESSTSFGSLSRQDKIGVLAHEIGHAIGLGHSEEKAALMYYRVTDQRKKLGQDDINGVTFLYPMKMDLWGLSDGGVFSNCSSLSFENSKDFKSQRNSSLASFFTFFLSLILTIAVMALF